MSSRLRGDKGADPAKSDQHPTLIISCYHVNKLLKQTEIYVLQSVEDKRSLKLGALKWLLHLIFFLDRGDLNINK